MGLSETKCEKCPLQDCVGLRELDEKQLQYMQDFKRGERRLKRGDVVLEEGSGRAELYTILSGVLLRHRAMEDGRRQIVNIMFPGDLVGLQAAFDSPASHSVEALIPSTLCQFDRDEFHPFLVKHPRLGYDLTWLAAKEETALEGHLLSLGQRNAKERVTYLALWMIDRGYNTALCDKGGPFDMPLTQAQIGDMLGMSLVHTNRVLKALTRERIVDWRPGRITIHDLDRACDYAQYTLAKRGERPFI